MWEQNLTIQNPFGVSVFGSALIKAAPDCVSIVARVSRVEQKPADSFAKARKGAQEVSEFLRKAAITEVGVSRVSLSQQFRYIANEQKFIGYEAKVSFNVMLRRLDRVEEVLTGLVDAGANALDSVSFQTTLLKERRAEARKMALAAAREKALIYAAAAEIDLGEIIHIQDVNPNVLQSRGEGHVVREPVVDNDLEKQPMDPGSINIGAAVLVAFNIHAR